MREHKYRYRYEQTGVNENKKIIIRFYNLDEIAQYVSPHTGEVLLSRDEYTGLLDKSGKEIYEGDIVKKLNIDTHHDTAGLHEWRGEVYYTEHASFMFRSLILPFGVRQYLDNDYEVIGNIYTHDKNGDLL